MKTLPSVEALAQFFACQARIESAHPELGILHYEVEFDSKDERVGLSVLPVAGEVNVSIFTKKPSRFIRLGLEDVSRVQVVERQEDGEQDEMVEIHFHNTDVQTLSLRLRPIVMLIWGNQHDSPERQPPWEHD